MTHLAPLLVVLSTFLAAAGCGGSSAEPTSPASPEPTSAEPTSGGEQTAPIAEPGAEESWENAHVSVLPVVNEGGSGYFDPSIVHGLLDRRASALATCYRRELASHPDAGGRVVIAFTLRVDGATENANAVEDDTGVPELAACAAGVIARLRFNPGAEGGDMELAFPFVFTPR